MIEQHFLNNFDFNILLFIIIINIINNKVVYIVTKSDDII